MSNGSSPYAPPAAPVYPQTQAPAPVSTGGDSTGGVIPYKNVPALIAYYCGVFSIIPCFAIGIAGFVLGIIGLKKRKENPAIKGSVHAWIGILAGGFFGLIWLAVTVFGVIGAAAGSR
jgi:hypothetical protein